MNTTTSPTEGQKDAMSLAFEISRQFVSIAVASIGFTVGMFASSIDRIASVLFWPIIMTFGLSVLVGLIFQLNGVNNLHRGIYNAYAPATRIVAGIQILLSVIGIAMLCFLF